MKYKCGLYGSPDCKSDLERPCTFHRKSKKFIEETRNGSCGELASHIVRSLRPKEDTPVEEPVPKKAPVVDLVLELLHGLREASERASTRDVDDVTREWIAKSVETEEQYRTALSAVGDVLNILRQTPYGQNPENKVQWLYAYDESAEGVCVEGRNSQVWRIELISRIEADL